jgi:hypothetical protein
MDLKGYSVTPEGKIIGPRGERKPWINENGPSIQVRGEITTWARCVCTLAHGEPEENQEVLHKNQDKTDCRPDNLCWATHQEVCSHMCIQQGSQNPAAKLDEADIYAIWRLRLGGLGHRRIAAISGISPAQAYRIITGQRWGYLWETLTSYV